MNSSESQKILEKKLEDIFSEVESFVGSATPRDCLVLLDNNNRWLRGYGDYLYAKSKDSMLNHPHKFKLELISYLVSMRHNASMASFVLNGYLKDTWFEKVKPPRLEGGKNESK